MAVAAYPAMPVQHWDPGPPSSSCYLSIILMSRITFNTNLLVNALSETREGVHTAKSKDSIADMVDDKHIVHQQFGDSILYKRGNTDKNKDSNGAPEHGTAVSSKRTEKIRTALQHNLCVRSSTTSQTGFRVFTGTAPTPRVLLSLMKHLARVPLPLNPNAPPVLTK